MADVRRRQMAFLGHIVRANGLESLATTRRISGTRSGGRRPRKKYLEQMKEVIGRVTTQQLLDMTRSRKRWRSITDNVFKGMEHH